jgi:ABC-type uncharacterized transport system fused permease/ATPase subunit
MNEQVAAVVMETFEFSYFFFANCSAALKFLKLSKLNRMKDVVFNFFISIYFLLLATAMYISTAQIYLNQTCSPSVENEMNLKEKN